MKPKAKAVLDELVSRLSAESTCKFVRDRLFSDGFDIPCRRWSALNQLCVSLSGTLDARGIRQWNAVGRRVRKGASAFSILIPILVAKDTREKRCEREEPKETAPGENRAEAPEEKSLVGFKTMSVFRVEDTEGDALGYEAAMRSFEVKSLPLIEVASSLGVEVHTGLVTPGCSAIYSRKKKEIILGTDNPQTFLHELSHAVDAALPERNEDYAFGEVVAELSSCFLGSLYGVPVDFDSTKAYIANYAGRGHVAFRIAQALTRVQSIYTFIEAASSKGEVAAIASPATVNRQESLQF